LPSNGGGSRRRRNPTLGTTSSVLRIGNSSQVRDGYSRESTGGHSRHGRHAKKTQFLGHTSPASARARAPLPPRSHLRLTRSEPAPNWESANSLRATLNTEVLGPKRNVSSAPANAAVIA
jgi:hypothetical protein